MSIGIYWVLCENRGDKYLNIILDYLSNNALSTSITIVPMRIVMPSYIECFCSFAPASNRIGKSHTRHLYDSSL